MKAISIQEPYASLIAYGYKKIETRSWATKYRGEILIHASKSKKYLQSIKDENILDLIKKINLSHGKIICKATIVDCIKMDDKFISEIKTKPEYILGIYEIGRYAWVLENIQLLTCPIEVKGKLNIWEYNI